ncbi:hypothetical protein JTE90_008125 [Oedothorax gibbosus]|uniref:PHD-type domain-containing protein n=1 Tax=Oedothorax gibbosus TaxID=931172 RepID=A0AAV6TY01_9ARAC|nr:hypothetical protein JTE90_008125 [Oedothorax gibbosus]
MQNTSQTFRGPGAPGVNFAEHSYDNHIGAAQCQPTGYQSYSNPPYHPVPSPRPHHYANHQMQQPQNMPYRHHGGAYAPNQYGQQQNMSQDMYRNHHSGYGPPNPPRTGNMPSKPWSENASQDMMYGHPQMMNNSPQMSPVNTMRSPPHATSNMNPTPPQGQQHYRQGQMQSPAHSPHSWSQAQIPSPGVVHRTTPSPLQSHARSPGHSQQPFSPPQDMCPPPSPAMNMPLPPENGQPPPPPIMNSAENHNPLHSLQKMVMLEQDPSKVMGLPMLGEEQQFAPANQFVPPDESASNESKDSAYSTYYNMDENRFESKPNIASDAYSTVQQVSNCNFPLPQHSMNSEESREKNCVQNLENVPCANSGNSTNMHEALHADPPIAPISNASSVVPTPTAQCQPAATQDAQSLSECPPHAESAPAFTDQTEAAVATNSEQALVTTPDSSVKMTDNSKPPTTNIPDSQIAGVPCTSSLDSVATFDSAKLPDVSQAVQIKTENMECKDKPNSDCQLLNEGNDCLAGTSNCVVEESSMKNDGSCTSKSDVQCKKEVSEETQEKILNSETIKLIAEVHKADIDSDDDEMLTNFKEEDSIEDIKKPNFPVHKIESNFENSDSKVTSSSMDEDSKSDAKNPPNKCDNSSSVIADISDCKPMKDFENNPVKVVIHRIRKDDTSDTWHVPGSSTMEGCQASNVTDCNEKKSAESPKVPSVGPQIIILSPASSTQKKFGFQSSVAANNIITIDEDISIIETIESNSSNSSRKRRNSPGSSSGQGTDKKRGRPFGSKNKMQKPSSGIKKKKGRRGRKNKLELSETKTPETPSTKPIKRGKVFNGPYVHIVGNKNKPSSIKVVNVAQKEEEKVSKVQPKRSFNNNNANRIKKKPVGHLSTLSPTYDAFNRDKTWLCVFCHKGSHVGGLGDLYGPYYVKDKNPESTKSSPASTSTGRGKRRKSEVDDTKPSKRTKHSVSHETPSRGKDPKVDPDLADMREVWIHEDCAVWCQGISLMAEEVQGLEDAITEARENVCCKCSLNGATLGCWGKSCKEQYHYSCAKETGCQMDIEKFSLLCPTHQKKSPRSMH